MVDGSSMIRFPLVIAASERDIPGIEPGPQGWYTRALTTGLQEVKQVGPEIPGLNPFKAIFAKNHASRLAHKHVVHKDMVDGSSMIRFPSCNS